jgi:hypothetical protein
VSNDEKASEAAAFAKEIKATFPVVHDVDSKLNQKFGSPVHPANVVIGRNGKVILSLEGADLPKLDAAVARAVTGR